MSSRNFFNAGLDLASLPSAATNAQIQQALVQANPASGLGIIIYQSTTPDVATYTEYATFLWINTTTGELKYWNGTSWQLVSGFATIADASVTVAKLSPTGGAALQLIRINAGGTAFEFVNPADLFSTNSFPLNRLVNAIGAGYVPYSDGSGVYTSALLATLIDTWLTTANIPNTRVIDVAGVGLPNQVAYIADTFNALSYGYVESLLRANQTPTNKLQYTAGLAGKWLKVNAGGTDIEGSTEAPGGKAAVVKYTGVANTAPQTISTTGSLQTVQFNGEVDPSSIISLSVSNQITITAAGNYEIDFTTPVNRASALSAKIVAVLRDITGASSLVTATAWHPGGDGAQTTINLKHTLAVTANNVYEIQIITDQAIDLGIAANLGSLAETYQQLVIRKLT